MLKDVKNLIKEDIAENLYNEIEKFAGYGFNKSHAAAYALIAFQTAFLKTHYPLSFYVRQCNVIMEISIKSVFFAKK